MDGLTNERVLQEDDKATYCLFEKCNREHTVKDIASYLNVCIGTVKRWILLRSVPVQYTFDLHKMLGDDIDYGSYSHSLKDQFYTKTEMARRCWDIMMEKTGIDPTKYVFIEPSAGAGTFLSVLPRSSIGMDIEPREEGIMKQDYLDWKPSNTTSKYIVCGNPPFGLRGHMALKFINHSYDFADYVCFILPQLFESDGKGSPRKRVIGYNLIHSEKMHGEFFNPDNKNIKVNCVFQIWSKYDTNESYTISAQSEEHIKIYSLSDGGTVSSTRNKKMIGKCDIYLPSTCYGGENMKTYKDFEELPGRKGYGVVFNTNRDAMIRQADRIDWKKASFLSTNSAYNLRSSIIFKYLSK